MWFVIFGTIFLVTGILFLFAPKAVARVNQLCEKLLFTDRGAVKYHVATGIFFLIVAALMFVVEWTGK